MFSPIDLVVFLVGLVILWILVSIPAYVAGKVVTGGRATIGEAMTATLGGAIVYFVVLISVSFFLGSVIGPSAGAFALLLALLAWLAVYRAAFETSWFGALAIAILAVVVTFLLVLIVGALFGHSAPDYFRYMI